MKSFENNAGFEEIEKINIGFCIFLLKTPIKLINDIVIQLLSNQVRISLFNLLSRSISIGDF